VRAASLTVRVRKVHDGDPRASLACRDMSTASRHLAVRIDRDADAVYAYAADPRHLPEWASGLGGAVERVDGRWVVESPMGRVAVAFAPENAFGVLDHDVTLPSGDVVHNPMRVLRDGDGCEVVFTLRRAPGVDDAAFERDATTVTADLATLKRLMERR
jgi:hypothetical protein